MCITQWHYTDSSYTAFLEKHAELNALYVEGTRVEGVDLRNLLPCGIARDVVAREGKLYLWADFYSLAFARADDILQKWLEIAPQDKKKDAYLYTQAMVDQTLKNAILRDEKSFNDPCVMALFKGLSGCRSTRDAYSPDWPPHLENWRELLLVDARLNRHLFGDESKADEIFSLLQTWCTLQSIASGLPGEELFPTIREYLSIFPDKSSRNGLLSNKNTSCSYVLSQVELLRMASGDSACSRKLLGEEQARIEENKEGDDLSERIEVARNWKVLFNDHDKVAATLSGCPSYANDSAVTNTILLASAWLHLAGDVERASGILTQIPEERQENIEDLLALARAWKNIAGNEEKAASLIKQMERTTNDTATATRLFGKEIFCSLGHYEILQDETKSFFWTQEIKNINVPLSWFFQSYRPDCNYINWLRGVGIKTLEQTERNIFYGQNSPGKSGKHDASFDELTK